MEVDSVASKGWVVQEVVMGLAVDSAKEWVIPNVPGSRKTLLRLPSHADLDFHSSPSEKRLSNRARVASTKWRDY